MSGLQREPGTDPIAELLRLAGPRTAIPQERAMRVKSVARGAWLASVRRRARVRVLIGLAMAAGIAALAVAIPRLGPSPLASPVRVVAGWALRQSARTTSPEGVPVAPTEAPSGAGAPVLQGTSVETDPGSIVFLRLSGGASVRLAAAARVRVESGSRVRLDRGTVTIATAPGGVPLQVRTRWGVVRDIGTEFEVRVTDDGLRLRVRTGAVALRGTDAAREEERVDAGTELTLSGSGVVRRAIPPDGPDSFWALEEAPAFDIEGRSLREFLAWAAKEKGLGLRFTPDSLEASTSRTVLHGSIAKMTSDEALRAVLPTTGFDASAEGAHLVVRSRR